MFKRKEVIGDATLYLGDCLEVMPILHDIETVVTSPPYWDARDYGEAYVDWNSVMGAFYKFGFTDACQLLINLGPVHREGEVLEYWHDWVRVMRSYGWKFYGKYIWDKLAGYPGCHKGRLSPSHEFIFHFNRTPRKVNKIIKCKAPGREAVSSLRGKDGVPRKTKHKKVTSSFKPMDSVIRLLAERNSKNSCGHPAVFPVGLPELLIKSYSQLGGVILDPFMGSGTTGVACMNRGRKFIGIELEEKYFDIACKRIDAADRQGKLFKPTVEEVEG